MIADHIATRCRRCGMAWTSPEHFTQTDVYRGYEMLGSANHIVERWDVRCSFCKRSSLIVMCARRIDLEKRRSILV